MERHSTQRVQRPQRIRAERRLDATGSISFRGTLAQSAVQEPIGDR